MLNGYKDSIELSLKLVGHMKFSPEHYFGISKKFKKSFRCSSVSTTAKISAVAEQATMLGHIILQLIRTSSGKRLVTFYRWTACLSQTFSHHTQHHIAYDNFEVSPAGAVTVKKYSGSDEITIKLLKDYKS